VTAKFRGESEDRAVSSPPFNAITIKNSPLWKTDPDQQLYYYTIRVWARRYVPEILMGVYAVDEFEEHRGPDRAKGITPAQPQRADYEIDHEEDEKITIFDHVGEEVGHYSHALDFVNALYEEIVKAGDPEKGDAQALNNLWDNNLDEVETLEQSHIDALTVLYTGLRDELAEPDEETESEPPAETDDDIIPYLVAADGTVVSFDSIEAWREKTEQDINDKSDDPDELASFQARNIGAIAEMRGHYPDDVGYVEKLIASIQTGSQPDNQPDM